MKKLLFVMVTTLLLAVSFNAYSADGSYFSIMAGMTQQDDLDRIQVSSDMIGIDLGSGHSYDPGIKFGAAYGLIYGSTRVEVEVSYATSDLEGSNIPVVSPYYATLNGDVFHITMFVNGYYDFMKDSAFHPFVTAGVGYSIENWDYEVATDIPGAEQDVALINRYLDSDDAGYAAQVGAGIAYDISDTVTMDVKYRYFVGDVPDDASHNVLLGVRFIF